jgi:hypothetical protein
MRFGEGRQNISGFERAGNRPGGKQRRQGGHSARVVLPATWQVVQCFWKSAAPSGFCAGANAPKTQPGKIFRPDVRTDRIVR